MEKDKLRKEKSVELQSAVGSSRRSNVSQRLLEARAARQLAELAQKQLEVEQKQKQAELEQKQLEVEQKQKQAELELKRLSVEKLLVTAQLEEEKALADEQRSVSSRSRHSVVQQWVDKTIPACDHSAAGDRPRDCDHVRATSDHQCEKVSFRVKDDQRQCDDIATLARAITDAMKTCTTTTNQTRSDKLLGRLSARDLPTFAGDPLEWLRFKRAFATTTTVGQYSDQENVARLQRCLKGEAWEAVAARLITVTSAEEIMKTLEMRFGRPELVVHKLVGEMKRLPKLTGSRSELIVLATKVSNIVAAIEATDCVDYLYHPELVTEVVSKLTENLVYRWIDYSADVERHQPRLSALSDYLMREAEHVCRAGVVEIPATRARVLPLGHTHRSVLATVGDEAEACACDHNVCATSSTLRDIKKGKPRGTLRDTKNGKQQVSEQNICLFCDTTDHSLDNCPKFKDKDTNEKWQWICDKKLCFKCFSPKHRREYCKSRKQCKTCGRGHHSLLHRDDWTNWNKMSTGTPINNSEETCPPETTANVWTNTTHSKVYLKVVPVTIVGPSGSVSTLALLDEGSTISLVDSSLAERVGADGPIADLSLQGAVGSSSKLISRVVSLTLRAPDSTYTLDRVRTVNDLTLPTQKLDKEILSSYSHFQNIPLEAYEGRPKILIGQDYWHLIIGQEVRQGKMNEPVASRTALGWVVHGFVSSIHRHDATEFNYHVHQTEADLELHELVKDYFRIDSIGVKCQTNAKPSSNDQRALNILDTKSKKLDCQWETGLLWRSDDVTFPDNKKSAFQRLFIIEKMMKADPTFAADYTKQVNNLLEKNYAEEVKGPVTGKRIWYLPHFGVRNPNKPGKLRLVHDAKAETRGVSMNTELLAGPDLLNSLIGVLFRFRERKVAITGDIREMFMRVKIIEEDQMSQLFLWRPNKDEDVKTYKMTSMIFGAKSSPCTATYILRRNADTYQHSHPRAVMAIKRRHYVDDYLDSTDTEEEMRTLVSDVNMIHASGGFEIRSFVSNKQSCLPRQSDTSSVDLINSESIQRALGMIWKPQRDELGFDVSLKKINEDVANGTVRPTKREILSIIMSVFDPLGFLSPFLIRGKILLQDVWRSGIQWDEKICDKFAVTWFKWLNDLKTCQLVSIPRCYGFKQLDQFQLHVFVDASEQAYAAVAYLRRDCGEVAFVAAKSRVAPLKCTTVPRLELQAALMGARLGEAVQKEQDLKIVKRVFWTDSRVVWHWIQNDPHKNKSFISNRIEEIRDLTSDSEWKWLPGHLNVADEATRAKGQVSVVGSKWIKGPDFLHLPEEEWPVFTPPLTSIEAGDISENETVLVIQTKSDYPLPKITRFSKWLRLLRATAYVLVCVERLKHRSRAQVDATLLSKAEELWIKQSQLDVFSSDILRLQNGLTVEKTSRLKRLSAYIDEKGILRLRGRANAIADVDQNMLSPVLLDGRHAYTQLLIKHFHEKAYHGNTETVVNQLRQNYWVLHLRPAVRTIEHICQYCKIKRSKPVQPITGDLPSGRLAHHQRPFSHCGLDYFGPMVVTIGRRREKRYGALFTCLTTRAVHIELAGSLTTDSAIMAMRRMMSRRGCPAVMYSDNGTNFHGASTELKGVLEEIEQNELRNFLANKRIEWRFNAPLSPHMGGAWERLVRSVKTSLKVVLKEQAPQEEVLITLLAEIEQIVNSRPLTHVSVDVNDPEALTPNHFLLGGPSSVPWLGPMEDVSRKGWLVAQRLADLFWKRWLREYLPTLLPRQEPGRRHDLQEGAVVIVADPGLPRNVWPKGVVEKLIKGPDNVARVALVRTAGGVLRRHISKLVPINFD